MLGSLGPLDRPNLHQGLHSPIPQPRRELGRPLVFIVLLLPPPSISSSVPFDWEAARSLRPPPYATPRTKTVRTSTGTPSRKAVVRKKSLYEKSVCDCQFVHRTRTHH